MCEALYLLGVMLLFMDLKVPGPTREELVIAHYRQKVVWHLRLPSQASVDRPWLLCLVVAAHPGPAALVFAARVGSVKVVRCWMLSPTLARARAWWPPLGKLQS